MTVEALRRAMTEPAPQGSLWSDLDLGRFRDLSARGFDAHHNETATVGLRLRTTFGAEASATSLFLPADVGARFIDARPSGVGDFIARLTKIPTGSELAVEVPFVDLGTIGAMGYTASGALLPTLSTIAGPGTAQVRLQRWGFATEALKKSWLADSVAFNATIDQILGDAWLAALAQLVIATACTASAGSTAYTGGVDALLPTHAVGQVQEAALGRNVVLIAGAGALARMREDVVSTYGGTSLEALLPGVTILPVPSTLMPAAGTALIVSPEHIALWVNENDAPTVQVATHDQSDFLQGNAKLKVEQRLHVELPLTKAAYTLTGLPT